jgi:hypothetical protein
MAQGASEAEQPVFVLTVEVVRWAIEQLQGRKVHTFFPAYLEIRRTAIEGESESDIHPDWGNLEKHLHVPGGPPGKPNFRPFWHRTRKGGEDWMNANIAGSYAPSSIRRLPAKVVNPDGSGGYSLKSDHARLALEHLLLGQAMPILPLAVFYYRDFGFTTDEPALSPAGLIDVFRRDFAFNSPPGREDFEVLFSVGIPDRTDWFQRWEQALDPGETNGRWRAV